MSFRNSASFKDWLGRQGIGGLVIEDPPGPPMQVFDFDDLREGETYAVGVRALAKKVIETQQRLTHLGKALEDELASAIERFGQDLHAVPELRIIRGTDGLNKMEVDAAVVGPAVAYVASHKAFVTGISDVAEIRDKADAILDGAANGDPSYSAFAGKDVIPVFMAEACKSPKLDKDIQATCRKLGVIRVVRSGDALRELK